MSRLVVVSNRIAPPDNKGGAGGLAVGVLGALKAAGGLWFGWSGETGNEDEPLKKVTKGNITWASFNLSEQDYEDYYCQFSNAVLWPAFHYRLDLVQFQRPAWEGYMRVNALLADKLLPLIKENDIIWVHDYHLLPFASELRKRGVNNRIGFFLHIPFPTPEIFNALPPHDELLEQLCDFDLLGFQTKMIAWLFWIAFRVKRESRLAAASSILRGGKTSRQKCILSVLSPMRLLCRLPGRCRLNWRSSRRN